jgi:hypothetical protein
MPSDPISHTGVVFDQPIGGVSFFINYYSYKRSTHQGLGLRNDGRICNSARSLRTMQQIVDAFSHSLMRCACRFFSHQSDQRAHLTAIALGDRREFGALGDRYADTVDNQIADLVSAIVVD